MKLCIRAHDLGSKGTENILSEITQLGIDGVQMVCYKAYDDIAYAPGSITPQKAAAIGQAFADAGKVIPLVGAYFNPVHSDRAKAERCFDIFHDYLKYTCAMGCGVVGSETGSFNDDQWTYNPRNRMPEAIQAVAATFSRLCDLGQDYGAVVAMEGAAGHVCWNVEALEQAQKLMNRKNTRIIFDLYNYLEKSNQGQYLDILDRGLDTFGDRILLFHMKDCCFDNEKGPIQVPYGTGQMDHEAILRKIKAHNPHAVLTLEETVGSDIPFAVKTIKEIWERV